MYYKYLINIADFIHELMLNENKLEKLVVVSLETNKIVDDSHNLCNLLDTYTGRLMIGLYVLKEHFLAHHL